MRLKCLACEVLARPLYWSAAQSPHEVDIELVEKGLHNQADGLRTQLQTKINTLSREVYDAVVLGYGLCGRATAGLTAASIPLVIPRAHDCVTLFLGSRARYNREFLNCPGTYWCSQDYFERQSDGDHSAMLGLGSEADIQAEYDRYVEKYGRENADYLLEKMGAWSKYYQRVVFLDSGLADDSHARKYAHEQAERHGWQFEIINMDITLLRQFLEGGWNDNFLVALPGKTIVETHDDDIMRAEGEPA